MNIDRMTKILFEIIVFLPLINLAKSIFSSEPTLGVSEDENGGRYQVSACAAESEGTLVHSGYYVLGTATGKVTASKTEDPRFKEETKNRLRKLKRPWPWL